MRIGKMVGSLSLNKIQHQLVGYRWILVEPLLLDRLEDNIDELSDQVIVLDQLGASIGDIVGFSEGGEAMMPFYPDPIPLDAYCACILDRVEIDHEKINQNWNQDS